MRILTGDSKDALGGVEEKSVQCCVTSPPYWGLRDYGVHGQLGLEKTPEEYVEKLVAILREVKRVLKNDGTLWLNLGDSYWNNFGGGSGTCTTGNAKALQARGRQNKPKSNDYKIKDLVGIPWMVAFALRSDGWYLRSDIIWNKPNPMPESVTDRPTKAHEYIFLLSKSQKYYYDAEAIKEQAVDNPDRERFVYNSNHKRDYNTKYKGIKMGGGGTSFKGHSGNRKSNWELINKDGNRNKRSVWTITTKPYSEAHFATFPEALPKTCILAGSKPGDTILDPFSGSGTTGKVALSLGRDYVGIELNPEYVKLHDNRITQIGMGI